MGRYKITYFENVSQSIKEKVFEGLTAFEDAIKWGKETLTNFSIDLIHSF